MKRWRSGLCGLGVAVMFAAPLEASPPYPAASSVDPCLVVCPAGDFSFRVVARRASGVPVAGAWVQVELCSCSDVQLVPNPYAPYSITDACWASRMADAGGVADLFLAAGGACTGASIRVFADGVLLATRTAVVSPDRDGDLVVEQSDLSHIRSKVGSTDPSADFDCDGQVTDADVAIAEAHFGHSAPSPVGVGSGSNGLAMLGQNRPNPFRRTSAIVFQLPRPELVSLSVFDVRGREVAAVLRDAPFGAGAHSILFDGRGLGSGVYLYRLRAGSFVATRRMALLQ